MRAEELVVFDNLRATLTIVTHAAIDDAADIARAKGRLDEIEALLARALPANAPPVSGVAELSFESSFGVEPYRKMVRHVQDYIAAGYCMQFVPSPRLTAPFTSEPVQLHRPNSRLKPSPALYYPIVRTS